MVWSAARRHIIGWGFTGKVIISLSETVRDWQFPHEHIPDSWPQAPTSPSLTIRCVVTNWSSITEGAHLVPRRTKTRPTSVFDIVQTETHAIRDTHTFLEESGRLWPTYHDCLVSACILILVHTSLHALPGPSFYPFITADTPRTVIRTRVSVDGEKIELKAEVLSGVQLLNAPNKRKMKGGAADEGDDSSSEDDDDL
ncbi:hypothetical protein V8E54_013321 [Elaphomyces granulatus]